MKLTIDRAPQRGDFVRINTDILKANPTWTGADVLNLTLPNQIGYCMRTRNETCELFIFDKGGFHTFNYDIRSIEVLNINLHKLDDITEFIQKHCIPNFDEASLVDSKELYPEQERLQHEMLNDGDINTLKELIPYESLLTHTIRALLCIKSLEERFEIIKQSKNGQSKDNSGRTNVKPVETVEVSSPRRGSDKRSDRPSIKSSKFYIHEFGTNIGPIDSQPIEF